MKYSVVIPTYNNCEKYLKPCIDSIIKHTEMTDVELVISANGCTDNTRAYLDYLKSNGNLIFNAKPLFGFGNSDSEYFIGIVKVTRQFAPSGDWPTGAVIAIFSLG